MVVKIGGVEIPAEQLPAICKKLETVQGACGMMDGNQMELYVNLKLETVRIANENAQLLKQSGLVRLPEVAIGATKFVGTMAWEGVKVVGHVLSWTHSSGLPLIH